MWAMALLLGCGGRPIDDDQVRLRTETVILLNAFRQKLGLEIALPDDRLDASAQAHADYLDISGKISHQETPGARGFLAATPRDRARLKGFVKPLAEIVSTVHGKGSEAYQSGLVRLMLQPYHRLPLFDAGPMSVGLGLGKGFMVMDLSTGKAKTPPPRPVVFPFDGQEGVPPKVVINEIPDPLRLFPGTPNEVGMPITVQYHGIKTLEFVGARLSNRSGDQIKLLVDHPGNDPELPFGSVICIPEKPLKPKTDYYFELVAKTGDQSQNSIRVTFTTGTTEDSWTVFASSGG